MAVQRLCTMEDKPFLRALWQMCFGDSDSFLDYYYEKRFYPEFAVCTIEDDKLVNAMYSLPVNMYIRGVILPAAIIAGLSTAPDYRGRGYVNGAFELLVNELASKGIALAPHTPVKHDNYFKQGNFSATDTKFITGIADKPKIMPPNVNFGRMSEIGKIYPIYLNFSEKYSGMLARSITDFKLKMDDLESDGGEFIIASKDGAIKGYSLYFNGTESLTAVETIYEDEDTAQTLVNALAFIADNKPIKIKLPPDCEVKLSGCEEKVAPQGVAAAADLPKLMRMIFNNENAIIKLTDNICNKNNGVFRLDGEMAEGKADIEISAGHFLQFVEGYKSLAELEGEGNAVINNRQATEYLDKKYPKCKCFIYDEY